MVLLFDPPQFAVKFENSLRLSDVLRDDFDLASASKHRIAADVELDHALIDLAGHMASQEDPAAAVGITCLKVFKEFQAVFRTFDPSAEFGGEGALSMFAPMLAFMSAEVVENVRTIAEAPAAEFWSQGVPEELHAQVRQVLQCVSGLRRVQIQDQSIGFKLVVKGLDVVPMLPQL
jgi:hypothetical protein